jgi:restriction system protein
MVKAVAKTAINRDPMDREAPMWGIHITGDRGDELFLKGKQIAIGWEEMGDLRKLEPTREAFKQTANATYPGAKHIINSASQLFRFVHEMQVGDYVVYRSKEDRQIHIGTVSSEYTFATSEPDFYPNRRSVSWVGTYPLTDFSQGALHELGSALTLFQVRNYAQEFRAAVKGETQAAPAEADETVGLVAREVEQNTRDYIFKRLAQQLKGYGFQSFVADLLRTMGYRTVESPRGTDEGIDIVAYRDELKLEPPIIKVQVKSTEGSVGGPDVKQLYGNLGTGELGLVVTLGTFARQAADFAKSRSNLRLLDGDELTSLVLQHYEELDPRYKTMLNLKRVYIPEPIVEES